MAEMSAAFRRNQLSAIPGFPLILPLQIGFCAAMIQDQFHYFAEVGD
jgi:hypothetical protein